MWLFDLHALCSCRIFIWNRFETSWFAQKRSLSDFVGLSPHAVDNHLYDFDAAVVGPLHVWCDCHAEFVRSLLDIFKPGDIKRC